MNTSLEELDGPRMVQRGEKVDSEKLFNLCFDGPAIVDEEVIRKEYKPSRQRGTYAIFHKGKPVSQIGIFHDLIKMLDGTIQAGSIGGVGTHPEYRNQGLASRLLVHCARQLKKEGATLMLISGARSVYTRAGNVPHGKFMYFPCVPIKTGSASGGIKVRKAIQADALICSQLYAQRPLRSAPRRARD